MRFKPEGKRIWLDWAEELKRRQDELLETLSNEGVRLESCFLSNDGESLFYFLEASDFAEVVAAFVKSKLPMDAAHSLKLRTSLEIIEEMAPIFSFRNDDVS